jgi:hypothetical protein
VEGSGAAILEVVKRERVVGRERRKGSVVEKRDRQLPISSFYTSGSFQEMEVEIGGEK